MEDIKTVHYVSKDPIANLKVKVVVTRISALKRKPKLAEQFTAQPPPGQQQQQQQQQAVQPFVDPYVAMQQQQQQQQFIPSIYHPAYPYAPQGPFMYMSPEQQQQQMQMQMAAQGMQATNMQPPPSQLLDPNTGAQMRPSSMPEATGSSGRLAVDGPMSINSGAATAAGPGPGSAAAAPGAQAAVQGPVNPQPLQRTTQSLGPRPIGEADEQVWSSRQQFSGQRGLMQQQQRLGMMQQQPGEMQQPPGMMQQQPGTMQQQELGVVQPQPRMTQQQPGVMQQQPGMMQQPPGMMQQQPGTMQQQLGVVQQQPGMTQQQPGMMLQQPGIVQQQPGMMLQQPGIVQQQPGMMHQPGTAQQQLGVMQQQPGVMQQPGMQQGMGAQEQLQWGAYQAAQLQQQQQQPAMGPLASQWQQHQMWQQQQPPAQAQQQQMQLDPVTGQWVSMGPLLGLLGPQNPGAMPMGAMHGGASAYPPSMLPVGYAAGPGAAGMVPVVGPDGTVTYMPAATGVAAAAAGDAAGAAALGLGATEAEAEKAAPFAPEKQTISRTFSWQEKVYSRSEVAAMHEEALQQGVILPGQGMGPGLEQTDLWQQQDQQQQQLAALDDVAGIRKANRHGALGSHTHTLKNKNAAELQVQGSVLFTYINSDEFCEREEIRKTVTTSEWEQGWPLFKRLMGNAKTRQQVLNFRSMYIMADLADDLAPAFLNERVLVSIKAFPDGSFDMRPGFSKEGCKYRFEDSSGGIYEYSVENASLTSEPTLEKRTAKLQRAVAQRATEARQDALKLDFQAAPGGPDGSMRFVLLGEIMSAADFDEDNLYVEFCVQFDPQHWDLITPWAQADPGLLRGVTQASRMRKYPEDPASSTPARWVAHFAHPFELEMVSKGHVPANRYPNLLLQVCTYNRYNRYTCEGYGWLGLGGLHVPGSCVRYVHAWKPLGSMRDKLQEFFIGGSKELEDMAYLSGPAGTGTGVEATGAPGSVTGLYGRVVNKYGFKTESVGVIKVRLHSVVQKVDAAAAARATSPARLGPAVVGIVSPGSPSGRARNRRELSLNEVVARARARLKEARGGDMEVRPGLVSEVPIIRLDPSPTTAPEGGTAQLKVVASGLSPLRYQWYKDDRKLTLATADASTLILTELEVQDQGQYYCQVSNKDGSVNSAKVLLKVERAGRWSLARAMMGAGGENRRKTAVRKSRLSTPTGAAAGPMDAIGEGATVEGQEGLQEGPQEGLSHAPAVATGQQEVPAASSGAGGVNQGAGGSGFVQPVPPASGSGTGVSMSGGASEGTGNGSKAAGASAAGSENQAGGGAKAREAEVDDLEAEEMDEAGPAAGKQASGKGGEGGSDTTAPGGKQRAPGAGKPSSQPALGANLAQGGAAGADSGGGAAASGEGGQQQQGSSLPALARVRSRMSSSDGGRAGDG